MNCRWNGLPVIALRLGEEKGRVKGMGIPYMLWFFFLL
jgi:hypothetical protein